MGEIYCGIDFHKKKSWIYMMDEHKKELIDVEILSSKVVEFLSVYKGLKIALEATGGANHLATRLTESGHEVTLVETNQFHPRNKKRGRKTDREDAISLCKYLRLDELPEVFLKSEKSRQLKTLLVQREHLINHRRNFTNHIRGVLREYGYVMPQGVDAFSKQAGLLIEKITEPLIKELLQFALETARTIMLKEAEINRLLENKASESEDVVRLMTIPGIGTITALCMLAVVEDISRFPDARKFGAYLGLTPREFSSGEKQRLGAITRSGPEMLRRYLIHGSRAVLTRSGPRLANDPNRQWAERVKGRCSLNKAVVALAHRNARIAFGMMKSKTDYNPKHVKQLEAA
jgi:transposase